MLTQEGSEELTPRPAPPGRLQALRSRFPVPGVTFREGAGGLASVEVENRHATARLALQGAHLLSFAPREEGELLWVSEAARFAPGVPIRGGIPLCWPWFGPHATDPALPQHGFARTAPFQVVAVERLFDERTRLTFRLPDGAGGAAWPHRTELVYVVTVGRALELDLVTRNAGDEPVTLSQALHAYLRVSDYRDVTVHGVEGHRYLDQLGGAVALQDRPLSPSDRLDRIYQRTVRDCVVEDPGLGRALRLSRRNSHSTVIWNPGLLGPDDARDFGPSGSREFLCVEAANAGEDAVQLQPHAVHLLFARLSAEQAG